MNVLKRRFIRTVTVSLLSLASALFFIGDPTPVHATANFFVSPATGTHSGNFAVDIMFTSESTDTLTGFELNVAYTGPIAYVSIAAGNANCSPLLFSQTPSVNFSCLPSLDSEMNSSGSLGRITFRPTGTGTATISVAVEDSGGVTVGTTTGGSYNIVASGSSTGGSTQLPNTASSMDILTFSMGFVLAFAGVGMLLLSVVLDRVPNYDAFYIEEPSLIKKSRKV